MIPKKPTRRVVRPDGTSFIESDEMVPVTKEVPGRGVLYTEIWKMLDLPLRGENLGVPDLDDRPLTLPPPPGGLTFRIVDFPPMTPDELLAVDGRAAFASIGSDNHVHNVEHPSMHRTQSVDFGIVLRGSIQMFADDGWIEVNAGEIVVQLASNHAWENHSEETCTIAFVLVDHNPAQ